jgi:hypothetical protein
LNLDGPFSSASADLRLEKVFSSFSSFSASLSLSQAAQIFRAAAGSTRPESAHGTNPASAIMAGLKIIPVKTDSQGSIET